MRQWKPGDLCFVHYAKIKVQLVNVSQDAKGRVHTAARLNGPKGAPKNIAVKLNESGIIVVVPYGNVRIRNQNEKT